jgi:hypothetical protein
MAGESRKGLLSSAEGATARKRSGKKNGMPKVRHAYLEGLWRAVGHVNGVRLTEGER